MSQSSSVSTKKSPPRIGIIGGGVAGSTIALHLSAQPLDVTLLEQGPSLVNGPPICHLHAGGNLYREIDQQQCLTLLRQSIDTLKLYKHSADYRPTVIAIPQRDPGEVKHLLPRLQLLRDEYHRLVVQNTENKVLGEPEDYYTLIERDELEALVTKPLPAQPHTLQDWLIPVAKTLDFNQIKFPLIIVQEYGLSVFRLAATATIALEAQPNCHIATQSQVKNIQRIDGQWQLTVEQQGVTSHPQFDYIINACGYQSGTIDDYIAQPVERLVEFKAAYVTQWSQCQGQWPEVIFYGERGTPNGMAQLTPYPGGYFQIHGMTQDITLFEQGLVKNSKHSAQPQLAPRFINKLTKQWPPQLIKERSQNAIDFMAHFIPSFATADIGGKPLFGAQQIPGQDPSLRAAGVFFNQKNYARCEIVKASSAIDAAHAIIDDLTKLSFLDDHLIPAISPLTSPITDKNITTIGIALAKERGYPAALANRNIKK
ncbi:FAD-dependent oxidoreductase [Psychrobium sp. 1_MG-2023]|uniref:FAD-dependent oxidoreductase n=1 Tax=Psychrobium sp. 1_MG-2023 TaxID=3062624 RepID=UPI0027346305|nr:FAD-dependent oxidoreductase [Psychrobium sp. 1_MG-2023]MDP2562710.1 FAD-dependent oxidoreductase [Psychrobium sp. 1_MG-2023]